jgi:hypothetical protein
MKLFITTLLAITFGLNVIAATPTSNTTEINCTIAPDEAMDPLVEAIVLKDLTKLKSAIEAKSKLEQDIKFIYVRAGVGTISFEKGTPLMYAIQMDWYEGVLELLRAGAKPNAVRNAEPSGFYHLGCLAEKIEGITPMYLATLHANADILKIMIIADGDTRGSMNVFYSNKCNVNGTNVKMAMWHMRENGPASMVEIIKDAKKAAWAQNCLPAEGQKPE